MSNPSHIAMLAQIRSDLFDDLNHVSNRASELRSAGDFRHYDATKQEGRIGDTAAAVAHVMMTARPTDTHDIVSLMHCVSDVADDLHTLAEASTPDMQELARLAVLIETTANNVVAFLALSIEPRTDSERRRTDIVVRNAALLPLKPSAEA